MKGKTETRNKKDNTRKQGKKGREEMGDKKTKGKGENETEKKDRQKGNKEMRKGSIGSGKEMKKVEK